MDSAAWVPLLSIVVGSLLTAFGSFVNGFVAHRRQVAQWKRDDKIRLEEQKRTDEEKEKEEKRLIGEERVQAYKAFAIATTFTPPLQTGEDKERRRTSLSETFTDVLLHATDHVSKLAKNLHTLVTDVILKIDGYDMDPEVIQKLEDARDAFWDGVRAEITAEKK